MAFALAITSASLVTGVRPCALSRAGAAMHPMAAYRRVFEIGIWRSIGGDVGVSRGPLLLESTPNRADPLVWVLDMLNDLAAIYRF